MKNPRSAVIIGAGIGGLATAAILAKAGLEVTIYEKNAEVGGRAGILQKKGFTFDTGPSWFLMPEVFEHFYKIVGENMHKHLTLTRIKPAYSVFFEEDPKNPLTITGDLEVDAQMFESIESGAGKNLKNYVARAEQTYNIALDSFLYTNFNSMHRFLKPSLLLKLPRMARLSLKSIYTYISSYVSNDKLKKILAYPMVFLGTSPFRAPALYHLMSYLDFKQGVYYPAGGMHTVIESIRKIAVKNGVVIKTNSPVRRITIAGDKATGVVLKNGEEKSADIIISNADMHFTETKLLPEEVQSYPADYWRTKKASPGAILIYLGVRGQLPQINHHTLLFAEDWHKNFADIFDNNTAPSPASLYICKPSHTDTTVAPEGHENMFVLIPVPADASITQRRTEALAQQYLDQIITTLDIPDLKDRIVYKKIVGPSDFSVDLNAWRGSALGLAHPLSQSALWRPKNKSKHLSNLYYVGGNTIPGIGLPMCLISSELVYKHVINDTSLGPVKCLRDIGKGHK